MESTSRDFHQTPQVTSREQSKSWHGQRCSSETNTMVVWFRWSSFSKRGSFKVPAVSFQGCKNNQMMYSILLPPYLGCNRQYQELLHFCEGILINLHLWLLLGGGVRQKYIFQGTSISFSQPVSFEVHDFSGFCLEGTRKLGSQKRVWAKK